MSRSLVRQLGLCAQIRALATFALLPLPLAELKLLFAEDLSSRRSCEKRARNPLAGFLASAHQLNTEHTSLKT